MMHGREKSDPAIVAEKPTNKAERSVAEPVERRAGAKGNANQQSTDRAQNRVSRVTGARSHTASRNSNFAVTHPRWEKLWAAEVVAPSSSTRTDGGSPCRKSMI